MHKKVQKRKERRNSETSIATQHVQKKTKPKSWSTCSKDNITKIINIS